VHTRHNTKYIFAINQECVLSNLIEQLNWRYATKSFDPNKKLNESQINTLYEALRLTPSSFGLQPWKFAVVTNQEIKDQLVGHSWNQAQVGEASHVFVLCRISNIDDKFVDNFLDDTVKTRGGSRGDLEGYEKVMKGFLSRMDENAKAVWAKDQVYIALGNLMTVCAAEGIDACPMEGFVSPEYDKVLGLKEKGLCSSVVCPVGFRNENDKYASIKKVRYSQEELFIHYK
jgi:nitroreductase/dihydropteridine reductase